MTITRAPCGCSVDHAATCPVRRREGEGERVFCRAELGMVWLGVGLYAAKLSAAEARAAADELHGCAREAERYVREGSAQHG